MFRTALLLVLLTVACGGKRKHYYVRVVEPGGRAYYTHTTNALYSEAGGFVTFRDLVTKEDVRLSNGKYSAEPCSEDAVAEAQTKYLANPKKKPQGTYAPGEGSDGSIWD
ncbi:MAG: hypothetical protein ACYTHK_00390 [Planctomycetota bacterium]